MTSCQSHSAHASPLSPPIPIAPSAADQDFSLSASSKTVQSSLKSFNDYVHKHYERFIEQESLERDRLVASFAEKEKTYEKKISTLEATHTHITELLAREQSTNGELRQRLDIATNSTDRLCKLVADANFVFLDRKQDSHEIKQEDCSQETRSMSVSDIVMCPNPAISSLLSQIETIIFEMNVHNDVSLPSPPGSSPCHSIVEALAKVANSLLATQRSTALPLEDFKSVDAARVSGDCQNGSLQEKISLLQEELKRTRGDNQRISQELAAVRLERENHTCRPPVSVYPTPAIQDDFPISLPSPPLEKRDLPKLDDILQGICKISRKPDQTPVKQVILENTAPPSTLKAGLSSTSTSISEPRRISVNEAVKRVKAKTTSSTTQSAPLESTIARNEKQTAGLSMPSLSSPIRGAKRTSNSALRYDDQGISNVPPTSSSTSAFVTPSTSDKTNIHRSRKKRRINGPSGTSLKIKSLNESPGIDANAARASTSTPSLPSASSSKHNAVRLPKTNASDLKSLKFKKVSRPNKPPSALASVMSSGNTTAPTKSYRPPMKPLELAKKSPQERAALRKAI